MPTVLRWRGCRFFFWSGDRGEPPHVHVKKGRAEPEIWLDPVGPQYAIGLGAREASALLRKVQDERAMLLRSWHDHFRT